jgi:predicted ATPase
MIDEIELRGFKAHKDTTIKLKPLTALVGPNSSGKSSVLQALHYISELEGRSPREFFQGPLSPEQLIHKDMKGWKVQLRSKGLLFSVFHDGLYPERETYRVFWDWGYDRKEEKDPTKPLNRFLPPELLVQICHTQFLKLSSEALQSPSYSTVLNPVLKTNGEGLASVVQYLKSYEDEAFEMLEGSVRAVIPQIKKLRIRPAKVTLPPEKKVMSFEGATIPILEEKEVMGAELVFDMEGVKEVPAHRTSEGTLFATALLALLAHPQCPHVILIDDIEQGLHPKAQRELIHVLRVIQKQRPELQIIMTTHSPYMLDELEMDEICVCAMDKEGVVHTRSLGEHPNAEWASKALTTGEFWGAEGEEWVIPEMEDSANNLDTVL